MGGLLKMIGMIQIWILLAIFLGVILRVYKMEGFLVLPTIENGRLRLNTVGTILIGFMAVLVLWEASPEQITTPLQALVFAYITPYALDQLGKSLEKEDTA